MITCSKCNISYDLTEIKTVYPNGKRGYCKQCNRDATILWNSNNKEKKASSSKQWYLDNIERHKELGKLWNKNNKELISKYKASWSREKKYSLCDDQWLGMLVEQEFNCLGCGDSFAGQRICTDHDHKSDTDPTVKRVRHLLCNSCNSTIGFNKEDGDRLRKVAAYCDRIAREAEEWIS